MKFDDFPQDCYSGGKFGVNEDMFDLILRYDCMGAKCGPPNSNGIKLWWMASNLPYPNKQTPLKAIRTGFNRSTHDERNRRFAWNDSRI
ncbi:MAG: hypothetical protein WCI11_19185 [Candidatus Methylumidiphilus sp.]